MIFIKISSKGRYSLDLLNELSNYDKNEYISLKILASKLDISFKYLEKIACVLTKNNYLEVSRGTQGGYRLSKNINEYKIGDILNITEKSLEPMSCVSNPNCCSNSKACKKYSIFKGLDDHIREYLNNYTLEDIN